MDFTSQPPAGGFEWIADSTRTRLQRSPLEPRHPRRNYPFIKNISFEMLVNHRRHELPDIFNKTKPAPRGSGRGSQVLLDTGDLRRLFEEVDSSSLARVPLDGYQGSGRGKVAEEPMFSEKWCSTRTRQQGENPKHHERTLFSRNSVGVGGQEPDHQRAAVFEIHLLPSKANQFSSAQGGRVYQARAESRRFASGELFDTPPLKGLTFASELFAIASVLKTWPLRNSPLQVEALTKLEQSLQHRLLDWSKRDS